MAKLKMKMGMKMPKASGDRKGVAGSTKIGQIGPLDTPRGNSAPNMGPGGKHRGAKY